MSDVLQLRLEAFFQERGKNFKLGPQSFIMGCPSCGKPDHFYVRYRDGRSICWKCGAKWKWEYLVAQIAGIPVASARELIFGPGAGDRLDEGLAPMLGVTDSEVEPLPLNPITLGLDFVPATKSAVAQDYLIRRGVDPARAIPRFDIRYHSAMNAVVFPITREGRVYGWQARRIAPEPGQIRLVTSTGFQKARFLLNWDRARLESKLILVEGPFDCLHVDLDGHGAIASLGKGVSQDQVRMILESDAREVYLGLDDDAAREVYEVFGKLALSKTVYRIHPPEHRDDFGEATPEEVEHSLTRAIRLDSHTDFLEVSFKG